MKHWEEIHSRGLSNGLGVLFVWVVWSRNAPCWFVFRFSGDMPAGGWGLGFRRTDKPERMPSDLRRC